MQNICKLCHICLYFEFKIKHYSNNRLTKKLKH